MARSWRRVWVPTAVILASPLHAQDARPGFAVLPFENSGSYGQDKKVFLALQRSIPASISSTLTTHPGIRVVDADRVAQAMKSQGLGSVPRVDAATASQLAKAVGARYIVSGSFADFYGKFRVNARLVDAQSGQILNVVSNDDPRLQDRQQLDAILRAVSEKLVEAAGLPPLPGDAAAGS
jgi:TolB-like protein